MSTLLKALRRADQPQFTPHMPTMGLPVTSEEERSTRWVWWLLAPLALLMGAGANYGWHLLNNRPIEEKVEVKEVITPPFVRVEPKPMITRPLPPPLPEPVVQPKVVAEAAPAASDSDGNSNSNSNDDLAERLMKALSSTPLQEEPAPQPAASTQAMPISALPPELKQQVPPLAYGSHVFSSNPANRAVVLNGREFREGSDVAPGVTLTAIAQDYIILQVAGQNVSLKALQDWRG